MNEPDRAPPTGGESSSSSTGPLALHVAPVHPAVRPDTETLTYATIRIRAAALPEGRKRPPLSAVLVLDVSRSMTGEPLAQVLHSAKRVAELLDDTDRLGIVTFSAGATAVAPLRPLAEGRHDLLAALPRIHPGAGTNISGGLAQAALLFPPREQGERQIALLMSDGAPTIGAVSPADLSAAGRMLKARDIAISTLGYGAAHNDDVLSEIAESGGGRYTFVIDPKLAEASFIRALGAQLDVVAERVSLLLSPGEGVEIVRMLEDPRTAVGAGGLRVALQDMIAGDELNVVAELRVRAPREACTLPALTVRLTAAAVGEPAPCYVTQTIDLICAADCALGSDPAAHAIASVALASETRAKARALADRGSFADAEAQLRAAQALLAATPGFARGGSGPLADAFETLADEIRVVAARPEREDYEVHRRAARDHSDFAMSGPRARGGGKLSEAPPSSRMLLDRALAGQTMPRAYLRVLTGPRAGLRLAIGKERFVIGRAQGCTDLTLPDADVSRQHSMIELVDGAFWLVDMGSTHGPVFKGGRVKRLKLTGGDEFSVADNLIRYEVEDPRLLN